MRRVARGFAPLSLELSPGNYEGVLVGTRSRRLSHQMDAPQYNNSPEELTHRVPSPLDALSRVMVVPPYANDDSGDILELFELPR
jgi:hypothetical protein